MSGQFDSPGEGTTLPIFYSRRDAMDIAQLLFARLSRQKRSLCRKPCCWIDVESISPSAWWQDEVLRALDDAAAVIIVASDAGLRSLHVAFELGATGSVPIVFVQVDATLTPPRVQAPSCVVNFTDPARRPWSELFAQVDRYQRQHALRKSTRGAYDKLAWGTDGVRRRARRLR